MFLGYGEGRLRAFSGSSAEDPAKSSRGSAGMASRVCTFQASVILLLTAIGYCIKVRNSPLMAYMFCSFVDPFSLCRRLQEPGIP